MISKFIWGFLTNLIPVIFICSNVSAQKMITKNDMTKLDNVLVLSPSTNRECNGEGITLNLNKNRRYEVSVEYEQFTGNEYRFVRLFTPTGGTENCFKNECWQSNYLFPSIHLRKYILNALEKVFITSWHISKNTMNPIERCDSKEEVEETKINGKDSLKITFLDNQNVATVVTVRFLNSVLLK